MQLAATIVDRITRIDLLEMAARLREAAAQLHGKHAQAANTNEAAGDVSETA